MTALYLECGLAGLVPLCLAWALWLRSAETRPVPVRVIRTPRVGAAHPQETGRRPGP